MTRRHFWLILIVLLTAVLLRLAALGDVPPGLTHDEADHGLDAWGVANGERPIYFTVGFGREPLYDYLTAVTMSIIGPTYLAGRLTSVFLSLIFIAATYAWVRKAFNGRTALLTAAGLAVGFWPLMTSRQALRSIALVAVLSLAAFFFWQGLERVQKQVQGGERFEKSSYRLWQTPLFSFVVAGFWVGVSFYSYIPARILWVIFPMLLLFLVIVGRKRVEQMVARFWWQAGLMLLVTAVVGLPLFSFLMNNPGAEVRLDELSAPLTAAESGDFQPLLKNTLAGLQIINIEGDHQWRYNLPGEPLLSPAMNVLFVVGLILALLMLFRSKKLWERGAAFFILIWLVAGLSPALVTGPELSTTQAIGLQPVLFIFPALTLDRFLAGHKNGRLTLLVPLIFGLVLMGTVNDYFIRWANAPEVRIQYESTLAVAVDYLNEQPSDAAEISAAISTTTPDRFHSPAAGLLFLNNSAVTLRWFNGQHSLLIPQGDQESSLIFSGFAPLSPYLGQYTVGLRVEETLPLRETDLDRPLTIYGVDGERWLTTNWPLFLGQIEAPIGADAPVRFGQTAAFLGYDLQTPLVEAGQEVRLVTMWQARAPFPDGVLFAQLLDGEGRPLAQSDRLDVPSAYWLPGDVFLQLHAFTVPEGVADGRYSLIIGLYTSGDEQRLPVIIDGSIVSDHLVLSPVGVGIDE